MPRRSSFLIGEDFSLPMAYAEASLLCDVLDASFSAH